MKGEARHADARLTMSCESFTLARRFSGEVSESAEGARLLSEYTGLNLYRGFKSLPLRQISIRLGSVQSKKSFLARD